ncbi:MAG: manganese efflux pump MntP family protein [Roseburia sp.]|nr:manganese efflux pump MntP family protein [Anaeroplasma bactoclasticum]MCM1196125.1 manganese efflux pump MntP family protein [Roseburia sp.]MCM1557122.1 manganese efflux pump MntP family protein [Anaeroplasma bactoclasticum]
MGNILEFYTRSILLGISLSMDACAVSMANGLRHPNMKKSFIIKMCMCFGIAQGIMPLIGYAIGHAVLNYIKEYIPWIALILLGALGINMIMSAFHKQQSTGLSKNSVILQALATSLDAMTIGFTIANYDIKEVLICVSIIGIITIGICLCGYFIGKRFETQLGWIGEVISGFILIGIGIEIFLKGMC